jgi:tetratricopeptide (TPR) repeat protein
LLAVVADQPEEAVVAALEAALRARLLVEAGEYAYQFAHDVIREVVEADLGAARRTVLHRRIAETLEQVPGDAAVELLAYHYSRSGEWSKAIPYLEQAGDKAKTQHANGAAEGYYRELVRRLEELGRMQESARAHEKLGTVLATMARYDEALEILDRAVDVYRSLGDLEGEARVTAQIGSGVHAPGGTPHEGIARIQPLLDQFDRNRPSAGLVALYRALSHLSFRSSRYTEALAVASRALELGRAWGDTQIQAESEMGRGSNLIMLGRLEEARRALEASIPLAEATGDLLVLALATNNIAAVSMLEGELDQGATYYRRAIEIGERMGDPAWTAFAMANLGKLLFLLGDWSQAHIHLEQAVSITRTLVPSWYSAYPLVYLGQLRLAEGEQEKASCYLEEAIALAQPSGDLHALRFAQALLAERDLQDGHPVDAIERLEPLLDRPGLEEQDVTALLPILASAHLELGNDAQAADIAINAVERAGRQRCRLYLVDALRVSAMVAGRRERREDAQHALDEAVALSHAMPYPYGEARALYQCGMLQAARDGVGVVRERPLRDALAIFRRLGAQKHVERTERAIAQLGRSV